jgi:hypothetical protein
MFIVKKMCYFRLKIAIKNFESKTCLQRLKKLASVTQKVSAQRDANKKQFFVPFVKMVR